MYGLYESLRDNAEETFIKIGYADIELNFKYPKSTLKSLLGNREMSDEELDNAMRGLLSERGELSGTEFRLRKSGALVTLSRECVKRMYEGFDENGFLSELYRVISTHSVTEDGIREVLLKHRPTVNIEKSSDPDFDLLAYSPDASDPYRYLFKLEHGHCDFHRLLPEDFEEIYKNDN